MFGNLFKNETLQKTILKKFTEKLREEGTKQVLITLLENDEIEIIKIDKIGLKFDEQVFTASKFAFDKFSISLMFVHTDADSSDDDFVFKSKIIPAINYLKIQTESICKNLVAIVPIQMTESWMIADKELLNVSV